MKYGVSNISPKSMPPERVKTRCLYFQLSETRRRILYRFAFAIGVIMFLLVMVYVPYGMNKSSDLTNYNPDEFSPLLSHDNNFNKEILERSGCISLDCRFICTNFSNLSYHLEKAFQKTNCTSIDNLQIEEECITNSTLDINYFKFNYTIRELAITNLNLSHITNEVFNSEIFTNTFTLTLQTPELNILSSGMLLGLTKLEYLTISSGIEEISRVFLQPVCSVLKYLKINGMTEKVQFHDIFGISTMANLYHLDASKNYFTESIKKSTFLLLPKLHYLNLADCNINVIEDNAFKPIWKTLKFLDISENKLKTIYNLQSAFEFKPIYMQVRDNDWKCNCELSSFVKIFTKYPDHFIDIPYCRHPQIHYGKKINAFIYKCKENENIISTTNSVKSSMEQAEATSSVINDDSSTTDYTTTTQQLSSEITYPTDTTTISPTKSPTITRSSTKKLTTTITQTTNIGEITTLLPDNIMPLQCIKHDDSNNNSSNPIYKIISKDVIHQSLTFVEQPLYEFHIRLLTNSSIQITIEESNMDINIIWFSDPSDFQIKNLSENETDFGCIKRENKSIIIENLKENTTYTICLMQEGIFEMTPFDCSPLYIPLFTIKPPDDGLNNDENAFMIAIISLIVVISTSIGGALSFFVIKSYPDLLEGSKNVLVVKDIENEPSSLHTINQHHPSLINKSINGNFNRKVNTKLNCNTVKTKISPPPFIISRQVCGIDSTYETPLNSSLDYQIFLHSDTYGTNMNLPKISIEDIENPPPLPKRNSEPIYGTIRSPVLQAKMSI